MRESSGAAAPDRRQAPRTKLVEIACIGMGPENGGLVLDVSDGGLSFHSVAPVHTSQNIQFLLSLRGHSRIEGSGVVVWTNEMKTVCGMKFTSLSSGAREYLNNWTNQSKFPSAPREKKPEPRPVLQASSQPISVSPAKEIAAPVFAIPPVRNAPLSEPQMRTIWQEPLYLWAFILVLGAVLAVAAFKYGVQIGRSEVGEIAQSVAPPAPQAPPKIATPPSAPAAGSTAAAQNETVHQASAEALAPKAAATLPNATLVSASQTNGDAQGAGQAASSQENNTAAAAAALHSEQQLQAGESELAAARSYLNGTGSTRDSFKAARLLWSAVGNGNSTAEVLLADLYVRGDGVPMSCEQGRILLVAAIKAGSIEAQQKLKDLNLGGCKQ